MWNRAAGVGRTRRGIVALAVAAGPVLFACSGDDGSALTTTTTAADSETTVADGAGNGTGTVDGGDDDGAAGDGNETSTTTRPEGALTDNSLRLLGDTLGIAGSCAGRADDERVEYRYELTNGGTLVLTLASGRPAAVVYDGFSGTFSATGAFVGVASTGDGFLTGTATLSAADGRTTELEYRATVPLRNCADVVATTTTTTAG